MTELTTKETGPDAEVLAALAMQDTVGASAYLRKYPYAVRLHTQRTKETALHWVVIRKSEAAARFLLERGADVNAVDASQGTPLLYAVQNKDDGIVDLLLRAGANVNLENRIGETPLLFAIEQGRPALCRALLAAGARVDKIAWGGESAIETTLTNLAQDAVQQPGREGPSAAKSPARAFVSSHLRLLMLCVGVTLVACAASLIFFPLSACKFWPVGEGACLGLIARAGQDARCRVIEGLLYEIKHEKPDVVIVGGLEGLSSSGACSDLAFLSRQVPADASPHVYRLVATAFEACLAARPYSENLLARQRSTPTFDEGELRRIANGSPCN